MWICGYSMTNLVEDDSAFEELLNFLHISSGVTLFFALVARIVVRVLYKPPPHGMEISRIDRVGAHFAHALLYVLPFFNNFGRLGTSGSWWPPSRVVRYQCSQNIPDRGDVGQCRGGRSDGAVAYVVGVYHARARSRSRRGCFKTPLV